MPPAGRNVWKRLAVAAGSTLGALLAAELGLRAWLALRCAAWDADAFDARMSALVDPSGEFVPASDEHDDAARVANPRPILHPYTGAEAEHDTGNVLRWFRGHPDSTDYEVVVVGGSVAAFFTVDQGEELARRLEALPRLAGRKVKVLNFAHASYKQPQQLHRVAYLLELGARPEAVINLDGFNEVALAMENAHGGTHPLYPSAPTWAAAADDFTSGGRERVEAAAQLFALRDEAHAVVERARRFGFARSCWLGTWTLRRLGAINVERERAQETSTSDAPSADPRPMRQVNGPDDPLDDGERMRMFVDAWFEGSVSLDAICRARGIRYLHVLQPALGDEGSKRTQTAAELALVPPSSDWIDGPRIGYPLLRERGEELRARGIAFEDASGVFADVEEQLYTDPSHFTPAGNRLLLDRVVPAFRDRLEKD